MGNVEKLPDEIPLEEIAELGMIELGKGEFVDVAGGGLKLPSCRLIGTLFAASTAGLLFARRTRNIAESCQGAFILPAFKYSNSVQKAQQRGPPCGFNLWSMVH